MNLQTKIEEATNLVINERWNIKFACERFSVNKELVLKRIKEVENPTDEFLEEEQEKYDL